MFLLLFNSSCVSDIGKVTDTEVTSTSLQTVPISVFDTAEIRLEIIKRLHKKPDTVKTVIVVPKTFEQQCAAVRKTYISQIGVREATGHNDGPEVEKYLASVGLGKGYPYCASGVHWTFMVNGIKTTINATAASTFNRNNLVWYKGEFLKTPHAADVVSFWIPELHGIHHCGFVDKDHGTGIYESVEYNTSVGSGIHQEGGGVDRKFRSWKATYACSRWIKE